MTATAPLPTGLQEGDRAPDFALPLEGGKSARLQDFAGKKLVLYFYPKDDTPGCTVEAKEFSAAKEAFTKANTVVLGASKDSVKAHDKFIDKYALCISLLSDPEGSLCESYGTWIQKSMYGKKYMGIDRATFLIDETGTIRRIWRKVSVKGHVDEVLKAAQAL